MPGIFPTGRQDDRSLMSSLLAGWVLSYESQNAQAHMNTDWNDLLSSQTKTLASYLLNWYKYTSFCVANRYFHSHLTQIHMESNTEWHVPSTATLERHPLENRPHNGHQYIDAVKAKPSSPMLSCNVVMGGLLFTIIRLMGIFSP